MSVCALCKKKKDLQKSHIIPRFVAKWLKDTSATGLLRGVVEPNKRLQDFRKMPLLCGDCEELFSSLETYFANEIFHPFFEKNKRDFEYDSRLLRFVVSLNWRSTLISITDFSKHTPELLPHVHKAEESWRSFLTGKSKDSGAYEHHIFFFDYLEGGKDAPDGFEWYTLRAVDAALVGNEERVLAYSKFPWMIFTSSIHPITFSGWENTRIEDCGKIKHPQQIKDEEFGSFLLDRPKIIFQKLKSEPFEETDKRILKSMKKRPLKLLESQSLDVYLSESKRKRDKKKEKLPETIGRLIWIIEGALEDPDLTLVQKKQIKITRNLLANEIVSISDSQAQELHNGILSTIGTARRTRRDAEITFETRKFIIIFMVNLYSNKDQQRAQVSSRFYSLLSKRREDDNRHLMVFSFNPYDKKIPYESALFIGY